MLTNPADMALIVGVLISLGLGLYTSPTFADNLNPCEYMNMTANAAQRLDIGPREDSVNFRRQYEDNNREMILACQRYQIKMLEQQKADLNRDNY